MNHCYNADIPIFYSEIGDFAIANHIFEVGGKNKTRTQIKNHKNSFLLCDGILVGNEYTIPLYLLGFLY